MNADARRIALGVVVVFASSFLQAEEIPLSNWTVPAYRASSASGGLTTMTDVTPGVGFVGVAPCRLVDTRQAGFSAGYGPPSLTQGSPRNFDLNSDPQCPGIPAGVDAYSLNITVTNTQGPGFILIYPQGGSQPTVSTVNYVAGQTIANAAIVPAGTGGGVTVIAGVSGTDLVIDINGYFTDQYNPGVSFHAVSAAPYPGATLIAENTSTAAGAMAIQGVITSTSAGGSSAAVRGINNNNTNNNGIGVWGSHAGAGWGVLGTSQTGFGAVGQIFGDIGIGVFGEMAGNHCIICNSAGVYGVDGGGPVAALRDSAGVRGESRLEIGVLGISEASLNGGGVGGVRGELIDSAGNQLAAGVLGFKGTTNYGVYAYGGYGTGGAVYSVDPDPQDASKVIRYVSLEGNESGTYFRGRGKFQNGVATIEVPEDFRLVTDPEGLTVQITPIGRMATVATLAIGLDEIVVQGSRDVEFSYMVNGVRKTHKDLTPIGPGREYMPEAADSKMPLWLTEGQKQMLISNGTYKADGTVNMETARRLGWGKEWEKRRAPAPQPTGE